MPEDAEAVLSHLKKRGTPMILREIDEDKFKPFSFSGMQKIVQRIRKELKLPVTFTLDACRHGGLTELEEAELTDGQGPRSLRAPNSENPMKDMPSGTCHARCPLRGTVCTCAGERIRNKASE